MARRGRHASRISRELQSATLKEKAKHMAPNKYTETDLKKDIKMMQEKTNKALEKFILEQMMEKEKLHEKIMELEKKMESIEEELKEKEMEMECMEELNQSLIVKERLTNDELQDARKALISELNKIPSCARAKIVIKRMGDLDTKPFIAYAKRHYRLNKEEVDPIKLVSIWEERLKDPKWHPFKVITNDMANGLVEIEEILDEGDFDLMCLKAEYGDDVYNAIVTALKELNEYNPSGRCPVQEIWNKKENRKATLKEGVEFILKQVKNKKQKIEVEDELDLWPW